MPRNGGQDKDSEWTKYFCTQAQECMRISVLCALIGEANLNIYRAYCYSHKLKLEDSDKNVYLHPIPSITHWGCLA